MFEHYHCARFSRLRYWKQVLAWCNIYLTDMYVVPPMVPDNLPSQQDCVNCSDHPMIGRPIMLLNSCMLGSSLPLPLLWEHTVYCVFAKLDSSILWVQYLRSRNGDEAR